MALSTYPPWVVQPASLVFTPDDWNLPHELFISARPGTSPDELSRGGINAVLLGPTESLDPAWSCKAGISSDLFPLPRCGDGIVDADRGERCENPDLVGLCPEGQSSCTLCNQDCQPYPGVPNVCGDGQVVGTEACDGQPSKDCRALGFDLGVVTCSAQCKHDTSGCVRVGACDAGASDCDPTTPALAPEDLSQCLLGHDGLARCWGASFVNHNRPPRTLYTQLADGLSHGCGLRSTGTAECWGDNTDLKATPRGGPFASLAVGHFHSCGLGTDGHVTCWGSDQYRLSNEPAGAPFTALVSGSNHVCALTQSGRPVCWGRRAEAQTLAPAGPFVKLAAAGNQACGLSALGAITCWGNFAPGAAPFTLSSAWPFVDVVASTTDLCGLTSGGQVVCAKANTGDLALPAGFVPVGLGTTSSGTCALDANGAAICWGDARPHEPLIGTFARIDDGDRFCGVLTNGRARCESSDVVFASPLRQYLDLNGGCALFTSGSADCAITFRDTQGQRTVAAPAGSFSRLVKAGFVACGQRTNGSVVCWGDIAAQGTGAPTEPVSDFAHSGATGCAVLASNGALTCWGTDPFGLRTPPAGTFTQVEMSTLAACALGTTGQVTCWGVEPPVVPGVATAITMGALREGVCVQRASGAVECFGQPPRSSVPRERFASLGARPTHAFGRTLDGGLRTFGEQAFAASRQPLVEGPIEHLALSDRRLCARRGGEVLCISRDGPLGVTLPGTSEVFTAGPRGHCWLIDGGWPRCDFAGVTVPQVEATALRLTLDTRQSPPQPLVVLLSRDGGALQVGAVRSTGPFDALETGPDSWCVRRAASTTWQCAGDGGLTGVHEPFETVSISRQGDVACGVRPDAGVSCWGAGLPQPFTAIPPGPWSEVRLGRQHACGRRADGSLACWGEVALVATQGVPAGAFDEVASGDDFSCAIRRGTRELVCWGELSVNGYR